MKLQKKTYNFKVTKFEPLTDTQWAKIQNFVEKPYLLDDQVKQIYAKSQMEFVTQFGQVLSGEM